MSDLARMRELSNSVCIVGVDESDEIGTLPGKSQLTLHIEAITNAVRDAGLKVSDVDGIFTAGQHSPATLGEAIGVLPRYVDGTTVGGCSFIIMVGHAVLALHHGLCDVAVVSHGESGRSGVGVSPRRDTALTGQFEFPYGFGGAPTYFGLITTRHMNEYGTTLEQWAQVAVSTRKWAALNPKARNPDEIAGGSEAVQSGAMGDCALAGGDILRLAVPSLQRCRLQRAAVGKSELPRQTAGRVHERQMGSRLLVGLAARQERNARHRRRHTGLQHAQRLFCDLLARRLAGSLAVDHHVGLQHHAFEADTRIVKLG